MSISDFYSNQEILITGGSGFLGKVIIEKIIRSLPNVAKIYILLRGKRNKSCDERLQELFQLPLFDRARKEQPDNFAKCIAINGDCAELGLNLSAEDLRRIQNVSIIFHSAASVRFDASLNDIVLLNVRGTLELLKIAENLKKLKCFCYISTAYSNPNQGVVEEKIYPPYDDWRAAIRLAETMDSQTLDILFPKYGGYLPNTYVFTKNVTENLVYEFGNKIPAIIYRPSIVASSVREPVSGWTDSLNGPFSLLAASFAGISRTVLTTPGLSLDLIGVDVTVKGLLVAAFKKGKETRMPLTKTNVDIYNSTIGDVNPFTLANFVEVGKIVVAKFPLNNFLWIPGGSITSCPAWHYLRLFTVQIGLSFMGDVLLTLSKKPPMFMKVQRRLAYARTSLSAYLFTDWKFVNKNFLQLENIIPESEREEFTFADDVNYDQQEYVITSMKGIKKYILNEPEVVTEASLRKRALFNKINTALEFIALFLIFYIYAKYLSLV